MSKEPLKEVRTQLIELLDEADEGEAISGYWLAQRLEEIVAELDAAIAAEDEPAGRIYGGR